MARYLELHMIQNFAPSNLNRDDTGNPKDCVFGGARRARISSQCLKRAVRSAPSFAANTSIKSGVRTKFFVDEVSKRLPDDKQEPAKEILKAVATDLYSKFDTKNTMQTAVLLYLSDVEMQAIAQQIETAWDDLAVENTRKPAVTAIVKELTKQFKDRTSASDIALFGRMLAEHPDLNIDAACQVAHAISTHRITMEMDFYTAVDELQKEDATGAGMMGFTGYDSACFYRYARLDWDQLVKNLNGSTDIAEQTVTAFLHAAIDAVPTGKQNSFAAHNPPSLTLAVVRSGGMGWSLANAFERPVRAGQDSGYVTPSVEALDNYWAQLERAYGAESVTAKSILAVDTELPLKNLAHCKADNRKHWVETVTAALAAVEAKP